jgi:hypothetical protein
MGRLMNQTQRLQEEGRKSRTAAIAFLGDALTSPSNPIGAAQLQECQAALFYMAPEVKETLNLICRRYSEPKDKEVLRACLLATAIESINRLFCD